MLKYMFSNPWKNPPSFTNVRLIDDEKREYPAKSNPTYDPTAEQ
jgi:hypothetical protein